MSLGQKYKNFLTFTIEPIYEQLKRKTAQRAKMQPNGDLVLAIIDDDETEIEPLIHSGIAEVAEKTGTITSDDQSGVAGFLKDVEKEIGKNLSEKEFASDTDTGQMITNTAAFRFMKDAVVAYVLYEWYEELGLYEDAQYFMQKCNIKCRAYRNRGSKFQPGKRKVHPVNL